MSVKIIGLVCISLIGNTHKQLQIYFELKISKEEYLQHTNITLIIEGEARS